MPGQPPVSRTPNRASPQPGEKAGPTANPLEVARSYRDHSTPAPKTVRGADRAGLTPALVLRNGSAVAALSDGLLHGVGRAGAHHGAAEAIVTLDLTQGWGAQYPIPVRREDDVDIRCRPTGVDLA
jgi:hypothetical protein